MRGNAQPDGHLLMPPTEYHWVVNASPLNYGRRVDLNFQSYFSRLWSKVHQIKFDAWECPKFATLFPIDGVLRSRDIRDQVAKFCKIARKLSALKFSGDGPQNFHHLLAIYMELSLPMQKYLWFSCAVFQLTMVCCVLEIFAIKSRSCAKLCHNFEFLGRQISLEWANQISDRIS